MMGGCQNWTAKPPTATVFWVCMQNGVGCLIAFSTATAIEGTFPPAVGIGIMYRSITVDRQVPDYALHGMLRGLLSSINGMQDFVVQCTKKAFTKSA